MSTALPPHQGADLLSGTPDLHAGAGIAGPQPVLTVSVLVVTGIPFWT